MRFIGVDPSVTGFASIILDENNNVLQEITLKGKKDTPDPQRLSELAEEFLKHVEEGDTLFIEGFAFGSSGRGVSKAYGIGWLLRDRLLQKGCSYLDIPPTRLKKYASDNGRAAKDEIVESVETIFGYEVPSRTSRANSPKNDDIADAYTLARMARDYYCNYYGTKVDVLPFQKKILRDIHNDLQSGKLNNTN